MQRSLRSILTSFLLVSTGIYAASWVSNLFESAPKQIRVIDRELSNAIADGEFRKVNPLLLAGANPNARVEGTTLFVQAFEYALIRDENNKIAGVDAIRADIARMLANFGPAMRELNRDLAHYLNPDGTPIVKLFESPQAAQEFMTFVNQLKENAKRPLGRRK